MSNLPPAAAGAGRPPYQQQQHYAVGGLGPGQYQQPQQPPPQHQQPQHYYSQQQQQQQQQQANYPSQSAHATQGKSPYAQPPPGPPPSQTSETDLLRQHVSTQLGLQLGSQMINAGQDYVNKNITQHIPMSRLKTYFNVNNSYVLQKLLIILLPFRHRAWQRTLLRDPAGQTVGYRPPREDINSPDLYIPVMGAVTYVLLVGVVLGLRKAFHPEKLGVTATGAIVFILCELLLVKLGAYLLHLGNDVSILDMLAIIGYNFVPLIVTLLFDLFLGRTARLFAFLYCSLAMAFFMLRSLRYSFLPDTSAPLVINQRRTRVHFLFGVVFVQIVCSYFLLV